jgi:hypothetical protein
MQSIQVCGSQEAQEAEVLAYLELSLSIEGIGDIGLLGVDV